MRITRLKLVNFIGINNGLGKDEIEIKFPKNNNIITMLSGKNGSGKSTIMSQLTPFKDSFDDRKTLILPGKEGLKEIDIEHDGHVYNIKHVYGKTAASFIKEDGVELNESSGVRSFEDIIKAKFKLTKEYFKVGKIGSNTTNFIQFNTSERKKYISTFVEAVSKYLDAFEIVNKKSKLNKQQIKQISDDLKKLDDVETLVKKIEENNKNLDETNLIISQTNESIGRLNNEIETLETKLKDIDYSENKSVLQLKKSILDKNKKINEAVINKYGNISTEECSDKINDISIKLDEAKEKVNKASSVLETEQTKKVNAQNSITKINAKVGNNDNVDLNEFSNKILEEKNKAEECKKVFAQNEKYYKVINENLEKSLLFVDSFKNFLLTVLSYYDLLNDDSIEPEVRNAELFFKPDFKEVFGNFSRTIVQSITNNRELYENKTKEYSNKSANLSKLDILNKRPKECKINSCPFIADALKYSNLPEELESLDSVIQGIKTTLENNNKQLSDLSDIKIAYSSIAKSYKAMSPRENIIYRYFISLYGGVAKFTEIPINDLTLKKNEVISETENIIQNINNYNDCENSIKILSAQYDTLLESEKTKVYFQSEINELNHTINVCDKNINQLQLEYSQFKNEYDNLEKELNVLNSFIKTLTENDNLIDEIKHTEEVIKQYEEWTKLKDTYTKKVADLNVLLNNKTIDRTNISNAITTMKATEITINQYTENLEKIQKSFNNISLVRDALDPKSGIPLIFIKSYLDGTESIANELLNIAYNGKFEIRFIPTASDFFIQVRSGNNVIEDIKLASQGEISLTTISISLALIERSIGEYNIVYLDEIDGPLDKDNRESFIHIIEKQIEKLGLEQIFVISHNNAFEDYAMNLVLLNGNLIDKSNSEYMKNKEIVYDVDGQ